MTSPNEPVCFPVCPKCAGQEGCELSSKVKIAPTSSRKVTRWRSDIVTLKCGQTVPSPVFMFGDRTQIWCETHEKWEKLAVKTATTKKWKESPIDEIPF